MLEMSFVCDNVKQQHLIFTYKQNHIYVIDEKKKNIEKYVSIVTNYTKEKIK